MIESIAPIVAAMLGMFEAELRRAVPVGNALFGARWVASERRSGGWAPQTPIGRAPGENESGHERRARGRFSVGTPSGNRTPNLLIKSQLLCQLSYGRVNSFNRYPHVETENYLVEDP